MRHDPKEKLPDRSILRNLLYGTNYYAVFEEITAGFLILADGCGNNGNELKIVNVKLITGMLCCNCGCLDFSLCFTAFIQLSDIFEK